MLFLTPLKTPLPRALALGCVLFIGAHGKTSNLRVGHAASGFDVKWIKPIWTGPCFPGGPDMSFQGTLPEVHEQILEINPNYFEDFNVDETEAAVEFNKRDEKNQIPPICGIAGGAAAVSDADVTVTALLTDNQRLSVPAGPGVCAALRCDDSINAALCNDNPFPIAPGVEYMANYLYNIIQHCTDPDTQTVNGQQFDMDNYNVLIKKGGC